MLPPSHNLIIYSISAGGKLSIADLFTAGILPGLLLALGLMITAYFVAKKKGYPTEPFAVLGSSWAHVYQCLPGYSADCYHLLVASGPVSLPPPKAPVLQLFMLCWSPCLPIAQWGSGSSSKPVNPPCVPRRWCCLVIGCAGIVWFGCSLICAFLPSWSKLSNISLTIRLSFCLLINLLLLMLGTFMDMSPLIVITTPIFLPVATAFGVDPIHFGVILILNLGIGLCTPPVGTVLFVGCAVGKIPVWEVIRTIWAILWRCLCGVDAGDLCPVPFSMAAKPVPLGEQNVCKVISRCW